MRAFRRHSDARAAGPSGGGQSRPNSARLAHGARQCGGDEPEWHGAGAVAATVVRPIPATAADPADRAWVCAVAAKHAHAGGPDGPRGGARAALLRWLG